MLVLATLVKIRDTARSAGWRLASIAVLLLAIAWLVYVLLAKEKTTLEPVSHLPKFRKWTRLLSATLVMLAAVPVIAAFWPKPPVEDIRFTFWTKNVSGSNVALLPEGEFYLTAPWTPATDIHVSTGKFRIADEARSQDGLIVIATNKEYLVELEIINPARHLEHFHQGDLDMRVVFFRSNGKMITKASIPFRKQGETDFLVID